MLLELSKSISQQENPMIIDYRFINIILFHGGCKERAHVV